METIIAQSNSFNKKIFIRNLIEYSAAIIVAISFSFMAFKAETTLSMFACLETMLASMIISIVIYNKGSNFVATENLSTNELVKNYKDNLQKQIGLLSKARYWYVGPLLVGLLVMEGEKLYFSILRNESIYVSLFSLLFLVGLGSFIIYLNEVRAVNGLKKDLDSLSYIE
jgi:hypothetical protein